MRIGVIGAGPSGLCLGMFLEHDVEVLEAGSEPGGHAGSFALDGYTFDNGPHIMFSRNEEVLDFMVSSLGDNVHRCRRKNRIAYGGGLVKYPFENDLASLPRAEAHECVRDYFINPWRERYPDPADLRQWFLHHFGEAMCEKYFFPYNEKVWNVPVAELSMSWADRIPQPPPEDVLKSAMGISTEGYLHQLYYHYPLRGGYQAISEVMGAAGRTPLRVRGEAHLAPLPRAACWSATAPRSAAMTAIVSTMPFDRLVEVADFEIPDRVREAVSELTINPLIVVSLGIAGEDAEGMTAVYFPAAGL